MKKKRQEARVSLGIVLLTTIVAMLLSMMSPAYAKQGGNKERLLVCHYDDEGELKAKMLPIKAANAHYRKHIPSEEPYLWSDNVYRCEAEPTMCTSGDRYEDLGDGTVRDCHTDLLWLKHASCADLLNADTIGRANWEIANAAAAALADGTCDLTDGSVAGDWRLPEIGEFCSTLTPMSDICPAVNAIDSLIDSSVAAPRINTPNPFVGVRSDIYWSGTELEEPGGAWGAFLSNGSVVDTDKSFNFNVWPVRVGQ